MDEKTKKQLNHLGDVAQERGKEAAKMAQQGVGALASRMGAVALGATVLLWIVWFFLPSARVSGGLVESVSFTFWNLLGTDFANPASIARTGGEHGFLSFLGLIAIIAPFVAPFIKTDWAKYLNAAPLVFIIIGWIAIYLNENKVFGDLAKIAGSSPYSWSWGLYLLLLVALVLAAQALRPPAKK